MFVLQRRGRGIDVRLSDARMAELASTPVMVTQATGAITV